MDKSNIFFILAYFVLAISTVNALNCIACSQYLNKSEAAKLPEGLEPCETRKDGNTIPCDDGRVCSTIYDPNTTLLTRGCDEKDICKNVSQNCSTCTTDMCGGGLGSSGFTLNPMFAPVLAGLLFAVLGR